MRVKGIYTVVLSCLLLAGVSAPAWAIQCAIYARAETGVSLYGDAGAWWGEAAGRYPRGHQPVPGAILVFKPSRYIRLGHVAVVSAVVNRREILVDQANWNRGQINHGTPVVDQSPDNDWSEVSVENLASHTQGRDNPTFGFVYPQATRSVILADRDLAGRELPERAMAERDSYRSQSRPMLRTAIAERAEIRHLIAKPVLAEVSDRDLAKAERQNLADRPIADRHGAAQAIAETQGARVAKKDKNEKRLAKTAGRKRGTVKAETTRLAEKAVPRKRDAARIVVAKAESAKARPEAAARDKRLAATKTAEKRLADAHRGDTHPSDKRLAAKEIPHKDAVRKDETRVAARTPAKHEVAKHEVAKTVVVARDAAHRPAAPAHLVLAMLTVRQAPPKPHPSVHAAAYKPTPAHAKSPHPASAARTAGAEHRRAHVAILLHDRRQKSGHRDF